jgi:hypothetical protein
MKAQLLAFGVSVFCLASATGIKHIEHKEEKEKREALMEHYNAHPKIEHDTVVDYVVDSIPVPVPFPVPYKVEVPKDTCLPKTIHPFSKGNAYYDSARKSARQPIGIRENEFTLADTAVDIHRSHPHAEPVKVEPFKSK